MKKTLLFSVFFLISLSVLSQVITCDSLGVGTKRPRQRIHLADGNLLIEGGGETAIIMKKDTTYSEGASGKSINPIFNLGRIIKAGDGDPEFRILYSDDSLKDGITIMEFDRKGIVASVKPATPLKLKRGSHFEGFYSGAHYPYFRLNSLPRMRLEMGEGGSEDVDVAIERISKKKLGFCIDSICKVVIDSSGRMGIGTESPASQLEIANGDLRISGQDNGLILTSQDGTKWKFTADNFGNIIKTSVPVTKKVRNEYKVNIYPNPSNNRISVVIDNDIQSYIDLEIISLNGKMVFMKEYRSNRFDVDINDLSGGVYILNIKDNEGNLLHSKKLVKN